MRNLVNLPPVAHKSVLLRFGNDLIAISVKKIIVRQSKQPAHLYGGIPSEVWAVRYQVRLRVIASRISSGRVTPSLIFYKNKPFVSPV